MTEADGNEARATHPHDHSHGEDHDKYHDWRSRDYVAEWIAKDRGRAPERAALLSRMMAAAPFASSDKLHVLDVGGGYGAVTEQALRAFPAADVVLQDFSDEMIAEARAHLARRAPSVRFVVCDLRDSAWKGRVGGPFDLVVSAIAIHNLRDMTKIEACYRDVRSLLKPDGCFLDCDHFGAAGGVDAHVSALRSVGFRKVDTIWSDGRTAIVRAA